MPAHDGSAAAAAQDHRLLASQVRLPCCSLPPCADRYIDRASIPALTGSSTSSLVRTMSSRTFSVWTRSPASHASRAAASRARTAPRTATSARLSGRSSPRSTRNTHLTVPTGTVHGQPGFYHGVASGRPPRLPRCPHSSASRLDAPPFASCVSQAAQRLRLSSSGLATRQLRRRMLCR